MLKKLAAIKVIKKIIFIFLVSLVTKNLAVKRHFCTFFYVFFEFNSLSYDSSFPSVES
jgi:hypothetical protein